MLVTASHETVVQLRGKLTLSTCRLRIDSAIRDSESPAFRIELYGKARKTHTKDLEKWLLQQPIQNLEREDGVITFETYDGDSRLRWVPEPAEDGSDAGRWIRDSQQPISDGSTWQDAPGRAWTAHGEQLSLGKSVADIWLPGPGPEES